MGFQLVIQIPAFRVYWLQVDGPNTGRSDLQASK